MKSICDGRKAKRTVVEEIVGLYKSAYEVAENQIEVMIGSCGELMTPVPEDQQQRPRDPGEFIRHCPKCKASMFLRLVKVGETRKMVGCSGFPSCKECVWIPEFITNVSVIPQKCSPCSRENYPVHKVELEFRRSSLPLHFECPVS